MMTSRLFKILAVLAVTSIVAGCKLEVVSVQGGDVAWTGGSCPEGSNCVIEITDPNFSNTFTVTPKPGYEFVKWQKAPGFLCGDSTNPVCTFTMPADDNVAAAVIGLFVTGRILPIYNDVGIDTVGDGIRNELDEDDDNDGLNDDLDNCPLVGPNLDGVGCPDTDGDGLFDNDDPCPENPTNPCALITGNDIVTANGKEWAQPDRFLNLSWNQINAVCPSGVCGVTATLNGYDMSGWTWASVEDMNGLFNVYLYPTVLGPGPGNFTPYYPTAAQAFFDDGWRGTFQSEVTFTSGWIGESAPFPWAGPDYGLTAYVNLEPRYPDGSADNGFYTDSEVLKSYTSSGLGAWFHR